MRKYEETSIRRCRDLQRGSIIFALCLGSTVADPGGSFAAGDADADLPSLAGDWTIQIEGQQRRLTLKQDHDTLTGVATKPNREKSFELSGTIDKSKSIIVRLYWDRSEIGATNGQTGSFPPEVVSAASKTAFDAALKEREDSAHPGLLPERRDVKLKYEEKAELNRFFESLTGDLILPQPDYDYDKKTGAFEKLKEVQDQTHSASITREQLPTPHLMGSAMSALLKPGC
jgi:hypothetical protein